jgi:NhaP-type Na+/H+ or K+/H+ antiporter
MTGGLEIGLICCDALLFAGVYIYWRVRKRNEPPPRIRFTTLDLWAASLSFAPTLYFISAVNNAAGIEAAVNAAVFAIPHQLCAIFLIAHFSAWQTDSDLRKSNSLNYAFDYLIFGFLGAIVLCFITGFLVFTGAIVLVLLVYLIYLLWKRRR